MITCRKIVAATGACALTPLGAFAQQLPAKVFRIGLLHIADEASIIRRGSLGTLRAGLADAGGMLGYGVHIPAMFYRAAYFIDKILKGAKPGDIPIEQAAKFDCVVNLKTAKAIGVKIPGSIMIRVTKVIE